MILVDTSVWIDHFHGAGSPEARRLALAIAENEDLCLCGLILTEVLQGIRSDRQNREVRRLFSHLIYLPMDRPVYEAAAGIYREARSRGRTLRNAVDCIIAACAIAHDVPLLHRDRDFNSIAGVSDLKVLAV